MFIARQPIFNRKLDVFGYELLFRSGSQSNQYDGASSSGATATVIGGLFEAGIDRIVGDKYAFVNFDENFIQSDVLELITPGRLIVEMLEDIAINDSLIERLQYLKARGYQIALDDFVEVYDEYPLIPLANIIKFDLMATPLNTIAEDVNLALTQHKTLLAEKIETKEEFLQAKAMGFHLFQGYFFSRPSITGRSCAKKVSNAYYTHIIGELRQPEPSFKRLAEIIARDASLTYRLMRIVSFRSPGDTLNSVKKALTYLGLIEIERWISVVMLQDLAEDKPNELINISLIRTKFAESIAVRAKLFNHKYEASIMGLFSILDALLDQTMAEALKEIAIPQSISDALIDHTGVLSPVYRLMLSYERGDWPQAESIANTLRIGSDILYQDYLAAVTWANEISTIMK